MRRIPIILLAAVLLWSGRVCADPTAEEMREEALELFRKSSLTLTYDDSEQEIIKGIELLQKAAALNDAQAQFTLGSLVLTQSVPPGTDINALEMFLKAARQGHRDSLFGVCAFIFQDSAVLSAEDKALVLGSLEKLSGEGDKEARSVLAPLYFVFGQKDKFEAELAHMKQQADAGDVESQYLLGTIYLDPAGLGFPKDVPAGLKYLEQAAEANNMLAQVFLAEMYMSQEGIKDMDKSLKYWEAAAAQGGPTYKTQVGVLYYELGRSEEDYKKAFKYLSEAAALNVREAKFYLANMYLHGKGVEKDEKKAEELFKESE